MKSKLACALVFAMVVCICAFFVQPVEAHASSGSCGDNLTWSLDGSGTLTISGTGPMWNYSQNVFSGIPGSDVRKVVVSDGVTSIGNWAFRGFSNMTSATIANSVTSIGSDAFAYCTQLQNVSFGTGLKKIDSNAFSNCTSLSKVVLPDGLTSIGMEAFTRCESLRAISIPDSLSTIYANAFSGCYSLTYHEYNGGLYLGNDQNKYVLFIKLNDTGVTSYGLHENTKAINPEGFMYCTKLEQLTVPDGLVFVGSRAFYECNKLQFNVLDSVNYLGNSSNPYVVLYKAADAAITGCDIPVGTKVICSGAFAGCTSLVSVKIPDTVAWIDGSVFEGCSGLTDVNIPDGITVINSYLFYGCSSLTSVELPASVTEIGSGAFTNCSSLIGIAIPEGVTEILGYTFSNCTNLKYVVIPESVVNFKPHSFKNCPSLWHVLCTGLQSTHRTFSDCGDIFYAVWHFECVGDEVTDPVNQLCALCCEHNYGDAVEVPPTCAEQGYTGRTCSNCHYTQKENLVDATGHTFGEWTVVTEPTCETAGEEVRSCVCGEAETNEIPAKGHSWDDGQVTKEPICVEDGELIYTCTNCAGTRTEVLPHTGEHIWDEGQVTQEPICVVDGEMTYTCTSCDTTRTEMLSKTGEHSWDDGQVTKEPTCAQEGEKCFICTDCGATRTEAIAKHEEHTYDNDRDANCNVCDYLREVAPEPEPDAEDGDATGIIILVVVLVAAGGVVAVILLKKKK